MMVEGARGIAPEIPINILSKYTEESKLASKRATQRFATWNTDFMASEESLVKETKTIANYAATNIVTEHIGEESIIHGAKVFSCIFVIPCWMTFTDEPSCIRLARWAVSLPLVPN